MTATLNPQMGSKGQNIFVVAESCLLIKLKGTEHRVPCEQIFCPYTQPQQLEWGQRSNSFFCNVVMLHIILIEV